MKKIIIIGAGPAGLTAGYELLRNNESFPLILEENNFIGGLSTTVEYRGNFMDLGGHRFFSKSDRIMKFWTDLMPLQDFNAKDENLLRLKLNDKYSYQGADPENDDLVMLKRNRISRILYLRHFFDYPISMSMNTFKNLGLKRLISILTGYLRAKFKKRQENNLEDFFINRFGKKLYQTFFKDYTEKVWGIPCSQIKADWGAQRIKGLSIRKSIEHIVKSALRTQNDWEQKKVETSLITRFLYPKYGPGQLWQTLADKIESVGGNIRLNAKVVKIYHTENRITGIDYLSEGKVIHEPVDVLISSMPIKDLFEALTPEINHPALSIARGLTYRDFQTVGLLVDKLQIQNNTEIRTLNNLIPDNWIYIQEPDVLLGRLQVFNNWSPYLVKDINKVWLGLEYFCNEGDDLWEMSDKDFITMAIGELVKIGIIREDDVLDSCRIRVKKAYPAYFGTYDSFDIVRDFLNGFENLYPIGRNGMHRYNNMDHSMMTAMLAAENIKNGIRDKSNLWAVNLEESYHESN